MTTEFASRQPAGTRNPRNPAHTPGVSSSGSAAAVAAGMLPLALGSQTGGSIIRPAAYCGVAGYKPSFKLLPTVGMKCFSWSLDTVGLFAAGVADAAFAATAITGRDLRVDGRPPSAPVIAIVRRRIGMTRARRCRTRSSARRAPPNRPARRSRTSSCRRSSPRHGRAFASSQGYEAFRALAFEYDRHRDRLGPELRAQLDDAAAIDTDAYDDARRTTRRARKALLDLLADGEVMLMPSAPGAAPLGLRPGEPTFNRLWTLLGTPCVNVPGLSDPAGLPLGVQIVARFGRDRFALSAAAFIEQAISSAPG